MSIRERTFPHAGDYPQAKADLGLQRSTHLPVRWKPSPDAEWRARVTGDEVQSSGASEVVLDFGDELVGGFSCVLSAPGEAAVAVHYGECYQEALCGNPATVGWFTIQRDEWRIDKEPREYSAKARRAFRYVRLTLPPGARWSRPQATLEHYPVAAVGTFECSDPLLNRAWEISLRTTLLCMQHYYEDGIKRDGMLWIGDYRVQYLCNAYGFGDAALARKSLFIAAASQCEDGSLLACACVGGGHQHPHRIDCMPGIPFRFQVKWVLLNYCADLLCGLREYIAHSGDRAILSDLWPCVRRLVAYLAGTDLTAIEPFCDYITDNCHPVTNQGFNSPLALRFLLCRAMEDTAWLAELAADPAIREVAGSFRQRLADGLRGDARKTEDGLIAEPLPGVPAPASWHVQSLAALSGVFSPAESAALITRAAASRAILPTCAGFANFYQLAALFEHAPATTALRILRDTYRPVIDAGLTTTPEALREEYSHLKQPMEKTLLASLCHGWSAGPCCFLPRHVLGVRPAAPGFAKVEVRPDLGDLAWARGSIPTPLGRIEVEWEIHHGKLRGHCQLPGCMEQIPQPTTT